MNFHRRQEQSLKKVWGIVLWSFGVTNEQVLGKCRKRKFVECRHTLMYLARFSGMTLQGIGKHFDRNHNTVLHGINNVYNALDTDEEYCKWLAEIVKKMTKK